MPDDRDRESPLPPAIADIAQLVQARAGLAFGKGRQLDLAHTVRRVAGNVGRSVEAFAVALKSDSALFHDLLDELVVGETYFMRDSGQFDLLRTRILPEILARRDRPVLWSAGCASGDEPYSLAIVCEQLAALDRVRIVGTDISRRALRLARLGEYRQWAFRGTPPDFVGRHFTPLSDGWRIVPRYRNAVQFRELNLLDDWRPLLDEFGRPDLIICRNLLIYLDHLSISRVVTRFCDVVGDRGWIVPGASDPLLSEFAPIGVEITTHGLVYRGGGPPTPMRAAAPLPPLPSRHPRASAPLAPLARPTQAALTSTVKATATTTAPVPTPTQQLFADSSLAETMLALHATLDSGNYETAHRAAADATRRFPLVPELHLLQSLACLQLGGVESALEAVRKALYLDDTLPEAWSIRAALLHSIGQSAEARPAWLRVSELCAKLPPDAPIPLAGEFAGHLRAIADQMLNPRVTP